MSTIFMLALLFSSVILILLILVQRGKGGGLAGALGGMGGQSAFGSKAGDTFTRITIGLAFVWILLCILAVATMKPEESRFEKMQTGSSQSASSSSKESASTAKPADKPAAKPEEKPVQ